jgi:Domain of unknown function (DUF4202)
MDDRLDAVIAAVDSANLQDPNRITADGRSEPSELVYGRRMSRMLERFHPEASEALKIAARAQHIERWTSSRATYPEGRVGYLRWRTELKNYHARRAGEIMGQCGYGSEAVARVQSLIRKERLKYDAEAQALEDVICLVFLEDYFADFAAKHAEEKVIDIMRKTWAKMSEKGQAAALKLTLSPATRELLARAFD